MNKTIIEFILFNLILFIIFLYVTFHYHNSHLTKQKKKPMTFIEFLNNSKKTPSFKNIILGLVFGIIFGFMDNFGLWMGVDKLEKFMPGGLLTKAALGNTYSDLLGAIIGTCISIIAQDTFDYDNDNSPIWLNTVGIVLGCLLGMFVGHVITGKS
jgi:hypothetical protein